MTSYAEARWLPRGWAHFALQFAVWFGFYAVYQVVRGAADREVAEAFWNGTLVIEAENRLHALIEPTVQGFVQSSGLLIFATSYTYWLSQFAVVGRPSCTCTSVTTTGSPTSATGSSARTSSVSSGTC